MNVNDAPDEGETVWSRAGRIQPPDAPANALRMLLAPRALASEDTLNLFGYYNIDVVTAGHYTSSLPVAIYVVLIERATGRVWLSDVKNHEDIPATYISDAGPPSVERIDNPSNTIGMSESGHFTLALSRHLGLAPSEST